MILARVARTQPVPAALIERDGECRRIAALLHSVSTETSSRNPAEIDRYVDLVPPGTDVYVAHIPGETHHRLVAAAARLRERGFNPVPHVAVRNFAGFTQLRDYLARLTGEAGVRQALVIAGDVAKPAGPYRSSVEVLETGIFDKLGVRRIGISGYPEGCSRIGDAALADALHAKADYARRTGLDAYIVTQFCFEAEPIGAWIAQVRTAGIDLPIRVGLAGPATLRTLLKFALRCNIGASIRAGQPRVVDHAGLERRRAGQRGARARQRRHRRSDRGRAFLPLRRVCAQCRLDRRGATRRVRPRPAGRGIHGQAAALGPCRPSQRREIL